LHLILVIVLTNVMPLKRLYDRLRAFGAAARGNVTLTFALALLPMVGLVGAAVDYSRATAARTGMQMALDATALAMARDVSSMNDPALLQTAQQHFVALFNYPEAENVQLTTSYEGGNGPIVFTATARIKTEFMRVMGFDSLSIAATSTAAWSNTKLQVALVLDNTGSMSEFDRIGALKIASHRLLKILKGAAKNPGDVQVAIIPFSNDVNVGKNNANASWIEWSLWDALMGLVNSKNKNRSAWSGCVTDREQPYNTLATQPKSSNSGSGSSGSGSSGSGSSKATLFPAYQPSYGCPIPLIPLTNDWTALGNLVDAMTPVGTTNQTIGLAWGWHALTKGPPLNAPGQSKDVRQVIVMLTDGLNTQDRWTNIFAGGNVADMDARTVKVCDNIKAADIQVYTVLVMSGNSSILQNCASQPNMYFALTKPDQMVDTFEEIGTTIANLRIAQ
jgi:Flp pilus assembly protein TadG